jgi:hypothetical protein
MVTVGMLRPSTKSATNRLRGGTIGPPGWQYTEVLGAHTPQWPKECQFQSNLEIRVEIVGEARGWLQDCASSKSIPGCSMESMANLQTMTGQLLTDNQHFLHGTPNCPFEGVLSVPFNLFTTSIIIHQPLRGLIYEHKYHIIWYQ